MRFAFWEIPDVAFVQGFVLVASVFVDGEDGDLAFVDEAPFSYPMPVQLSDCPFLEVLLGP